jgi:hypothetical protein
MTGWAPDQFIYTHDDVLRMLDALLDSRGSAWWGEFFADRAKPCPFFVEWPDENLVEWFGDTADRLHALWDAAPFSVRVLGR